MPHPVYNWCLEARQAQRRVVPIPARGDACPAWGGAVSREGGAGDKAVGCVRSGTHGPAAAVADMEELAFPTSPLGPRVYTEATAPSVSGQWPMTMTAHASPHPPQGGANAQAVGAVPGSDHSPAVEPSLREYTRQRPLSNPSSAYAPSWEHAIVAT